MEKECHTGLLFPFLTEDVLSLKNACVDPLGVAEQETMNELEERIPKFRPTHEQAFDYSENNSFNHKLDKEDFPPLESDHYVLRIIHCTRDWRLKRHYTPIIMSKVDFKSTYLQAIMRGCLSAQFIKMLCVFVHLLRCLPFG